MTITEIINKIVGLNPEKDYNVAITETQVTTEPQTISTVETTQITQPIEQSGQTISTSTSTDDSVEIQNLKTEIENLKKMNQALLSRTPVEDSDKSVEQMLYDLVVPKRKEN